MDGKGASGLIEKKMKSNAGNLKVSESESFLHSYSYGKHDTVKLYYVILKPKHVWLKEEKRDNRFS